MGADSSDRCGARLPAANRPARRVHTVQRGHVHRHAGPVRIEPENHIDVTPAALQRAGTTRRTRERRSRVSPGYLAR
jgi:hypothetical protein